MKYENLSNKRKKKSIIKKNIAFIKTTFKRRRCDNI